jgi:hypothetical protein
LSRGVCSKGAFVSQSDLFGKFEETATSHPKLDIIKQTMYAVVLSADAIAAIVFGIVQLGIGLISLWQQRRLRQAYGQCPHVLEDNAY